MGLDAQAAKRRFQGIVYTQANLVGLNTCWLYRASRTRDVNCKPLLPRRSQQRDPRDNQNVPRGRGEGEFPCEPRARW